MDNSGYDIGPHDEEYHNELEMDLVIDNPPDADYPSVPPQFHSRYTSSQENNVSSMPPEYTQHRVYGTDQVVWRRHFEEPIDMTPPDQNPLNTVPCPVPVDIVHNVLHIESNRLQTFAGKWPAQANVTPKALAREGFYYEGPGDRVRCVFCSGVLKHWEKGDVVSEEHKKHFPNCVVHRVRAAGHRGANPIIDSQQVAAHLDRSTTADLGVKSTDDTTADSLGIVKNKPKFPQYGIESTRLGTFRDWPGQIKQTPEDMAKAGLYYLGKGDQVMCFSCGGRLHTWDPTDDPMEEHAKWYPQCAFVKLARGGNSSSRNGRTVADLDNLEKNASVQALVDNGCKLEDISHAIEQLHMDGVGVSTIPSAEAIWEKIEEKSQTQGREVVVQNGHSQSSDDVQALLTENRELKEQRLCKVCQENEISVIFLPCGHLTCCSQCATSLSECPICRGKINGSAKAYWP
ncbi:baculoviral IAP repeat-containing protein 7-B-like [Haliotis cracherodii]|uniref:baculoviral IAP repeat-containing protein 7-B-like n=1 Tax=Haliotis cracherodii TaxID=6455 RepID=UPI0039EA9570